ncbi:ArsR/SmtB family transcription factor [Actinacidiphila sp. ITFR-21]|uniref:ArsR/SmtB family transcription factor n=1 Tax=Actinacidiphila sp. ITFR-21 TaxID=3075199 RepID=UPI00288A38E2|nr:metalloregulator ArsR/SmtB family transcription factor [Streptomyces sp. ITFR-21]WNI14307.1 metalloregulator ArsR/SmtB family transcription factor [Streptomyces sp. ITFR-21]
MRTYPQPKVDDIDLSRVLFALSDPTRLAIVLELRQAGELVVGEQLSGAVPKSTLSHHNRILRESGLTSTRPDGTRCYVSLRERDMEQRFPGMLEMLLAYSTVAHGPR